MKKTIQMLSITLAIAILTSTSSISAFASETISVKTAASVKLIDNYDACKIYYADDFHNTALANILFNKKYDSVDTKYVDNKIVEVDPGRMNSKYAFMAPYLDKAKTAYFHKGMDFKATKPVKVYSPISGIVLEPTPKTEDGCFTEKYGVVVVYDSVHDCSFNFQHLSEKLVNPGDVVKVSQLIGMSGITGADSYHLHVGLRSGKIASDGSLYNDKTTNYDPRIVLDWITSNVPSDTGAITNDTTSKPIGDEGQNIFQRIGEFFKNIFNVIADAITGIFDPTDANATAESPEPGTSSTEDNMLTDGSQESTSSENTPEEVTNSETALPTTGPATQMNSSDSAIGYIKNVYQTNNKYFLDIDYVEWITDPAAIRDEATVDGVDYDGLDAYLVNRNTKIRTFEISSDAVIGMQLDKYQKVDNTATSINMEENNIRISTDAFMQYATNNEMTFNPYCIGIDNGVITYMYEKDLSNINIAGTETVIGNGGSVVQKGDWVYYSYDDGLFKVRTDGTEKTKINDTGGFCINIIGNWIYFVDNFYYDADPLISTIYKVKKDGSQLTKVLYIEGGSIESMYVNNDWIYFSDDGFDGSGGETNHGGIYKIKADGTNITQITKDVPIAGFILQSDWVFYHDSNSSKSYSYYRVKTDGSQKRQISTDDIAYGDTVVMGIGFIIVICLIVVAYTK